jgi:hypothetical protein
VSRSLPPIPFYEASVPDYWLFAVAIAGVVDTFAFSSAASSP